MPLQEGRGLLMGLPDCSGQSSIERVMRRLLASRGAAGALTGTGRGSPRPRRH
ncbi:hypothetical protein HMPREF0682_2715 [Propionibacterium acidifaciens F0233]|uniref:Uncharacterized protein n=1 Tax=Propionibacterium acidifaciens F0233 TaxID=553198 RepID=U2RVG1_9ACTN|nr:hypothetical protein HMPREF0682_2715 [Propionibacterium acidifaciens F0233]